MKNLFMFLLMSSVPLQAAEKSDKQPAVNVVVTTTQTVAQASTIKKHSHKPHYRVERQVVPPRDDDRVEAGAFCCCFFRDNSK